VRYTFAPDVRRWSDGRVLLGGSPFRLLRLSASGRATADRLGSGESIDVVAGSAEASFAARLVRLGFLEPHPGVGEGPFSCADVTVVIPVRDRPSQLTNALAALAKVDADRPGRVVVVDDGSSDHRAVAAVAGDAGADIIRRDVSGGPAAARNTGLTEVRTPLVAFVDSDVTVGPGWLPWLLRSFADPAVALVAPRVQPPIGGDLRSRYNATRSSLDLGARPGPVVARSRVAYVPAAALVCRVDALRAVGGFDESMPVGEDVDLCWRLVDAGWAAWYAGDEAWVVHDDRSERSTWADWARRRFDYGTSAGPLDRRHPGSVAPLGVSGWSVAAWAAAVAGHPVVAGAVVAGTAQALVVKLDFVDERREVVELAVRGNLGAGELIGRALARPWFPVTLAAAVVSRRARRIALAAALVPPALEWIRQRPAVDPIRWIALCLADDVAYSAGVWVGALRERSLGALRPDIHDWPGSSAEPLAARTDEPSVPRT
jgi:mycofactocin system glycosyltransferase